MSNPFEELNKQCGRYAALYEAFDSLNREIGRRRSLTENGPGDVQADDVTEPGITAIRLAFANELGDVCRVDYSLDDPEVDKLLKIAVSRVSLQLTDALENLSDIAATGVTKINEAKACQASKKSQNSTTTPTTVFGSQSGQP